MKSWLPFLICGLVATAGWGEFPKLHLQPVVLQQVHAPTCLTHAGDGSGRLFVVDQAGQIRVIKGGMLLPTPFLDISSTAGVVADRKVVAMSAAYTERGLLSLAFHPGYADPASAGYRRFYVNYTKPYEAGVDPAPPVADHTPNCTTVIAEFQVSASDPDRAEAASERRLLLVTQPQSNHNGGGLVFDGAGLLYIGSGDGGGADDNNVGHTGGEAPAQGVPRPTAALGNGQDKTVLLGKILRIDPLDPDGAGPLRYGIPPSNPFVGAGGGVKVDRRGPSAGAESSPFSGSSSSTMPAKSRTSPRSSRATCPRSRPPRTTGGSQPARRSTSCSRGASSCRPPSSSAARPLPRRNRPSPTSGQATGRARPGKRPCAGSEPARPSRPRSLRPRNRSTRVRSPPRSTAPARR